ncbi:hypothetical protein GCM10023149_12760 [Mucilaginibacter gynuensis]|uniref:histidine kinase n=1 Tax=Mucilaginibacter gynuensis TaxID=1302236 RepID=A0ABP8G352_9SPHI
MNVSHFIFDNEQFNRLFPYFILINKNIRIDGCGKSVDNVITHNPGGLFSSFFIIAGYSTVNIQLLSELTGKTITVSPVNNPNIHLRGQLEYLADTEQFLFAGNTLEEGEPHNFSLANKNDGKVKGSAIFYEDILNEVPADIVLFDTEHHYLFINPTAIKDPVLRELMIGKKDEDYCQYANRPLSVAHERRAYFNEVLQSKKIRTWEEKIIRADGSVQYKLRNMYPVLDENNEVKLVIGYGLDITDMKRVEEQVKISEKRYRDLYNFSPALIYTHDMDGKLLSINPAITSTLGYNEEDVVNANIKDLLPVYDRKKVQQEYLDKLAANGNGRGILRAIHKNGRDVVYLFYQSYVVEEPNSAPYIIGFSHDITDRIKIEKELRVAKVSTESAARAKEIFLANMSHEIRTPMNGILGLNNLLIKTELDDQQRSYTRMISESVNNLLVIVNDILDIEKIGSGKMELESRPFNISNKISRTMQLFQYKSREKGLDLVLNNRLPEEFTVIGDQYRFAQILSNLINNAIKFTHKGGITISAALLYNANNKVLLEFSVKDTGIGISEDRLPIIFEPFMQGSSHITRKYGGTGLGLSICKSLVEMQGGHLKVNSQLGEGTEFMFSLTYKKGLALSDNRPEQVIDIDQLRNKKMLLAEDVELNQFLAKNLLESWGCEVDVVDNGAQAVEKVKQNKYDVILMDIQMPEMDGITATRKIRNLPEHQHSNVPIIAVTANALKGDSQYYMDAGMNDCVTKPYTEEKLFEKIVEVLKKEGVKLPEANNGRIVAEPIAESSTMEQITPPQMEENTPKLYDLTMIETIGKNSEGFVNKMIVMFDDITTQDFDKMKAAAAAGSWQEVGQVAHKLKSTVGNMGVDIMKDAIRELEMRTSNDPQALVVELGEKLERVKQQIRADHPEAFVNPTN